MVEQVIGAANVEDERTRALAQYNRKLNEYQDVEQRLKELRKKVLFVLLLIFRNKFFVGK